MTATELDRWSASLSDVWCWYCIQLCLRAWWQRNSKSHQWRRTPQTEVQYVRNTSVVSDLLLFSSTWVDRFSLSHTLLLCSGLVFISTPLEAKTAASCMEFSMAMMAAECPASPPSVWQRNCYWGSSTPVTATTMSAGSSHRSVSYVLSSKTSKQKHLEPK